MLAGTRLGNDAALAHANRQQRLPHAVVDLVRAGVQQVLTLQVNLGTTKVLGEPRSKAQRGRTSAIIPEKTRKLCLKCLIAFGLLVRGLEFLERRHQRLGNVATSIDSEASGSWV